MSAYIFGMDNVEKAKEFVRKYLAYLDTGHGFKHAERTAYFARFIAEKEGCDVELCVLAGWLHDLGRKKEWKEETVYDNHGIDGAKKAREFLDSLEISEDEVNMICNAISGHCFEGLQMTRLAKVLWDADKLNMFSKAAKRDYFEFWLDEGLSEEEIEGQMENERASYMRSFYTNTAKSIARNY